MPVYQCADPSRLPPKCLPFSPIERLASWGERLFDWWLSEAIRSNNIIEGVEPATWAQQADAVFTNVALFAMPLAALLAVWWLALVVLQKKA